MDKKYQKIIDENKKIIDEKMHQAKTLMTKEQIRKCNMAIHVASVASGAGGAVPFPVADSFPIAGSQILMVYALGKIFKIKVSESVAKGIIGAAASTLVGRTVVKLIPVAGLVISAAVAAVITEAIGWTIAVDFAKEARLRDNLGTTGNANQQDPSFEVVVNCTDKSEEHIAELEASADAFLSGGKKRFENSAEFDALLSDIENLLGILPSDHPLLKKYEDLVLIMD